jgi:hypothetical protein
VIFHNSPVGQLAQGHNTAKIMPAVMSRDDPLKRVDSAFRMPDRHETVEFGIRNSDFPSPAQLNHEGTKISRRIPSVFSSLFHDCAVSHRENLNDKHSAFPRTKESFVKPWCPLCPGGESGGWGNPQSRQPPRPLQAGKGALIADTIKSDV